MMTVTSIYLFQVAASATVKFSISFEAGGEGDQGEDGWMRYMK